MGQEPIAIVIIYKVTGLKLANLRKKIMQVSQKNS